MDGLQWEARWYKEKKVCVFLQLTSPLHVRAAQAFAAVQVKWRHLSIRAWKFSSTQNVLSEVLYAVPQWCLSRRLSQASAYVDLCSHPCYFLFSFDVADGLHVFPHTKCGRRANIIAIPFSVHIRKVWSKSSCSVRGTIQSIQYSLNSFFFFFKPPQYQYYLASVLLYVPSIQRTLWHWTYLLSLASTSITQSVRPGSTLAWSASNLPVHTIDHRPWRFVRVPFPTWFECYTRNDSRRMIQKSRSSVSLPLRPSTTLGTS